MLLALPVSLFAQNKKEIVTEETLIPELNVVNNTLYVKNAPVGAKLEIITIVGNKVLVLEMKASEATYTLNLPKAIYIFKIGGVVRKFVLK
ncbi:hypothetical protein AGMMS50262_02280 [Bacteroidia bacterium]|nr:hypothetical protein AGMMS50262_02280 [Bacteroidia bacterium]